MIELVRKRPQVSEKILRDNVACALLYIQITLYDPEVKLSKDASDYLDFIRDILLERGEGSHNV